MFKKKRRRSREFKKNNQVIDFEEARRKRLKKRQTVDVKENTAPKEKAMASRRKAAKKNRRKCVYAAICMIIIAAVGLSIFNIFSLKAEQREVLEANEALKQQKARLTQELANVDNPEYIEQQARMQLRLIMPGETLYILPKINEAEAASEAAAQATDLKKDEENKSGDD